MGEQLVTGSVAGVESGVWEASVPTPIRGRAGMCSLCMASWTLLVCMSVPVGGQ